MVSTPAAGFGRPEGSPQLRPSRRALVFGALGLAAAPALGACSSGGAASSSNASNGRVEVTWFVGLGTGADQGQPDQEKKIVDAFNASQSGITLKMNVVPSGSAGSTLTTQLAGGNAPDIVGPVGIGGSNAFDGRWLDLAPLIKSEGFDTSIYNKGQLDGAKDRTGAQVGLPLGVYPSFIWYNKELFDEAKLPYPPEKFGAPYADGRPWDMNTVRDLAKKLTVDGNGNDATSPGFDPSKVVQWGWDPQYTEGDPRGNGTFFGAGTFVASDNKTAQIPAPWLAEWKWYYDMIWKDRSAPNNKQLQSDALNKGNAFATGKIAMTMTHTWYLASVKDSKGNPQTFWNIAANPSWNGKITDKQHVDTFRILKSSKHPKEAFTVLKYLLTTAAADLVKIYNAMPANKALQADYFKGLDETWTQGVHWQVATDALQYPDIPPHEGWMPNYSKANDRIGKFGNRMITTPGLNLDAEAAKLKADLQTLFSSAG
jgi:multiple sugar transport system substrate-binding protein